MEKETPYTVKGKSGTLSHDSTPHASLGNDDAHQAGSCFLKPPLPVDKQIDHLVDQGIAVDDRVAAQRYLLDTNYYRLRGYWMTFEQDGVIQSGTSLEAIWQIHEFDRELRHWLWRVIERVELKARTQFAYVLSNGFGPDAHTVPDYFADSRAHARSMNRIAREIEHGRKQGMPCVLHNLDKYGKLPLWAAVEVMSMGTVSSLYGNLKQDLRADSHEASVSDEIAASFGVSSTYLRSWLRHLTMVRNICAHHNRFYNRLLKINPRMLKRDKCWSGKREFPTFVILKRIYEASWPEIWQDEANALDDLIRSYPTVDLEPMGFPKEWRSALGIAVSDDTAGNAATDEALG